VDIGIDPRVTQSTVAAEEADVLSSHLIAVLS
jgi:hypothetical protein